MNYLGIELPIKHAPKLDPGFVPFGIWMDAYAKGAKQPLAIAVEREKGSISVRNTFVHGTPEMAAADYRFVERYVKWHCLRVAVIVIAICKNHGSYSQRPP